MIERDEQQQDQPAEETTEADRGRAGREATETAPETHRDRAGAHSRGRAGARTEAAPEQTEAAEPPAADEPRATEPRHRERRTASRRHGASRRADAHADARPARRGCALLRDR